MKALSAEQLLQHLDVSPTLPEALGQHGDHVFVVVQQLLHQLAETRLHVLLFDLQQRTTAFTDISSIPSPQTTLKMQLQL